MKEWGIDVFMGISTVLLAYKEADNLRVLLPQIKENLEKCGEEYEILIIDTAEPLDDTKDVCEEFSVIYINQEEPFFGGAFRTGIKHASMSKFLIMDSDGSHNPKDIPEIYHKFSLGADVVIGSRYISGGKTNDSVLSQIMSKILNTVFRLCLGIKAKDISTDYRMYDTNALKKVDLGCDNYDILQEVLMKLGINNPALVIYEVPVSFDKRIFGETKRRLIPFIISYIKTLVRLTVLRFSLILKSPESNALVRQIALYGVIGFLAAVVDFSMFSLINAHSLISSRVLSNIISSTTGFCVSFSLNTYFNFRKTDKIIKRFLSYLAICVVGISISSSVIYALQWYMTLSLLKVLCIAVVAVIQFILNKLITFRN